MKAARRPRPASTSRPESLEARAPRTTFGMPAIGAGEGRAFHVLAPPARLYRRGLHSRAARTNPSVGHGAAPAPEHPQPEPESLVVVGVGGGAAVASTVSAQVGVVQAPETAPALARARQ